MDEQQKNEHQEQNSLSEGMKKVGEINKKAVNASKKMKKVIKVIKNVVKIVVTFWKPILIILLVSAIISFVAGLINLLIEIITDDVNDAKKNAIVVTYSEQYDDSNAIINTEQVVVKQNENKTGYELSYNNDTEYLEDIRNELEDEEIVYDAAGYSDLELAVLGALMDNGADLEGYSEEDLHCFLAFIKAEACTQNLDLRKNEEKFAGNEQIAGNYVPKKMEDLAENEIPGTILVQRTNTNGTTTILEYLDKNEFEALINNPENNVNAKNYFTINDDGELVIAKWNHTLITVEGEYPQSLDDIEKVLPRDENRITIEPIAFNQYISKYTMPFEFLLQLLTITEKPDFCMELVDHALNSKIVINIQEKETITETTEERYYTVHSKDEKYVNYNVNAAEQTIVQENDYFLNNMKDDKEVECTNYSKEERFTENNPTVRIYRKYTNHSYSFEILEVDTWVVHFKKVYEAQTAVEENIQGGDPIEKLGEEYKEIQSLVEQPIIDQTVINQDEDVKNFINNTKNAYQSKIIVPKEIKIDGPHSDENGDKYKILYVKFNNNIEKDYDSDTNKYYEIKDESGNGTGEYKLPQTLKVWTDKVPASNVTKEIPQMVYTFVLEISEDSSGQKVNNYKLQTNINPLVTCIVSSLNVKEFEKLDVKTKITTIKTEFPVDPNPITTDNHIYSVDADGNYEKFLVAYDKSKGAQNQLNSIDSWLYEMMEEREETVELVEFVKYLLYKYDGQDRGIIEEQIKNLIEPDEIRTNASISRAKYWWPIGSSQPSKTTEDGIDIYGGDPVSIKITSKFGYRGDIGIEGATADHDAIDIGAVTGTPVITVANGKIQETGFNNAMGNYIIVDHGNGVSTLYQHLHSIDTTMEKDVIQGEKIGTVGATGVGNGAHLHFAVRINKQPVDPLDYVDPNNPRLQESQLIQYLYRSNSPHYDPTGTKYKMYDDGGGIPTIGKGDINYASHRTKFPEHIRNEIDAKLCSTNGTNQSGKHISELDIYVDIAVVDDVSYQILSSDINFVESSTKDLELKQYQIDALVAATYHYGQGGVQLYGFVEAYKEYGEEMGLWNTWWYKNGFNYYGSAAKGEFPGWLAVNEARYELFVTGNYDVPMYGRKYIYYTNAQIREMGFYY